MLNDRDTGAFAGLYSTFEAYHEELAVLSAAGLLTQTSLLNRVFGHAASNRAVNKAERSRTMRPVHFDGFSIFSAAEAESSLPRLALSELRKSA